jgi:hypothetical protein
MGYIKFDTSDDLVSREDFTLIMGYCYALQRRHRPIDFSLEMFAKSGRDVPRSSRLRCIIVVDVIMDELDRPWRRELAIYSQHAYTLGLKATLDEAFHRAKILNLALGDPTTP